jgi:hypothetical protein
VPLLEIRVFFLGRGVRERKSFSAMVDTPRPMVGYNSARRTPFGIRIPYFERQESFLGRVIHTTNPTRQRNLALKKMISSIREFLRSPAQETGLFELAASLTASLQEIYDSVDRTAEAWEKRDYWLKADAFRRQWSWVERFLTGMKTSLASQNRTELQTQIIALGEKLGSMKTS